MDNVMMIQQAVAVTMMAMRRRVGPHPLIAARTVFPTSGPGRGTLITIASSVPPLDFDDRVPTALHRRPRTARSLRTVQVRGVGGGGVLLRCRLGLALEAGSLEGAERRI